MPGQRLLANVIVIAIATQYRYNQFSQGESLPCPSIAIMHVMCQDTQAIINFNQGRDTVRVSRAWWAMAAL